MWLCNNERMGAIIGGGFYGIKQPVKLPKIKVTPLYWCK